MMPLDNNINDVGVDGMFPKDAYLKTFLICKPKIMLNFNNYKMLQRCLELQFGLLIFGFIFG
jgi:hypothetical protein